MMMLYSPLLLPLLLLSVQAQQEQRRNQLGGYHAAQLNDPSVQEAAKFAVTSLAENTNAYTSFALDSMQNVKINIDKAETQVGS
jgi:hypothetical protein